MFDRIKRIWWNIHLDMLGIKHGKLFSHIPPTYIYAKTGTIKFGDNLSLNHNVTIDANDGGSIIIGNNVAIGMNTVIRATNHNIYDHSKHTAGKIIIEDNVWIGANCVILPDVTIGSGSVIGAGSIVPKDIPKNVVAVGNPCKPIKDIVHEKEPDIEI